MIRFLWQKAMRLIDLGPNISSTNSINVLTREISIQKTKFRHKVPFLVTISAFEKQKIKYSLQKEDVFIFAHTHINTYTPFSQKTVNSSQLMVSTVCSIRQRTFNKISESKCTTNFARHLRRHSNIGTHSRMNRRVE